MQSLTCSRMNFKMQESRTSQALHLLQLSVRYTLTPPLEVEMKSSTCTLAQDGRKSHSWRVFSQNAWISSLLRIQHFRWMLRRSLVLLTRQLLRMQQQKHMSMLLSMVLTGNNQFVLQRQQMELLRQHLRTDRQSMVSLSSQEIESCSKSRLQVLKMEYISSTPQVRQLAQLMLIQIQKSLQEWHSLCQREQWMETVNGSSRQMIRSLSEPLHLYSLKLVLLQLTRTELDSILQGIHSQSTERLFRLNIQQLSEMAHRLHSISITISIQWERSLSDSSKSQMVNHMYSTGHIRQQIESSSQLQLLQHQTNSESQWAQYHNPWNTHLLKSSER